MDIQKLIGEVLGKLNADNGLLAKFKSDPLGTVKSLLSGLNLDGDALKAITDGVSAKVDLGNVVEQGKGIFDKVKGIFGK